MSDKSEVIKECISCNGTGHTYLECRVIPFGELMAGAFDLPDLTGQRERVEARLRERASGSILEADIIG